MRDMVVLVTGASGTIGRKTVAALAHRPHVRVRAALHNPAKAAGLADGVGVVPFEWEREHTWADALHGVATLLLLTPIADAAVRYGNAFVDAAARAGVRHVVKLSAAGAEVEPGFELGRRHRETERHLERSGLHWTHLRPNCFMENFLHYHPPTADGDLCLPLGTGATSYVAAADVADVAAAILADPALHRGAAYALNGPDALTAAQVAGYLAEACQRPIRYVDVTEAEAEHALRNTGMAAWRVRATLELFAVMKAGYLSGRDDTVERVASRPATRFSVWARDHAGAFGAA